MTGSNDSGMVINDDNTDSQTEENPQTDLNLEESQKNETETDEILQTNLKEEQDEYSDQSFVLKNSGDFEQEELSEQEAFNLAQGHEFIEKDSSLVITKDGQTLHLDDFSEEELDNIADTAIETLKDILQYFNVAGAEIEEFQGDDNEIILDVVGGDLAVLIGRHGATLDALQQIVSTINFNKLGFRYPITIDIESYKHRQKQKLIAIAKNAASRAVKQHKSIRLRAMNPYERRLVHMILKDDIRVQTQSEGKEPYRRVVITPIV
ncbi:MAG: KH domain-containing protein [Coriobacteriales bacterium]|nr:KH domain-containing protein [Coriobacteriales bacterium]